VAEFPEEIPTPEVTPPPEEVRWGAEPDVTPEEEAAPAPVVEEVPGVAEMEIAGPPEEAIAPPAVPAVEAPVEPFAAQRAHLKEHPRDYEAWLELARALWQAGERQEALEAYGRVVRRGKLLESAIPDLEEHVQEWPSASTQRVLGDAYMKDGRLQEALDIYRRALETL
jgi:cytochrome c-type biogenesis protein CcmH/NrfG